MVHAAVRSVAGTLLFHSWREARALWDHLTRRIRFFALVLLPDHIHVALPDDAAVLAQLSAALRGYALERNHARNERGPVWQHGVRPTPIRGREHEERTRRYIHLNPCRRGLVGDPLGWPFSTHRDLVGLAIPAVCHRAPNPERYHAYVSSDPSVGREGTLLPPHRLEPRPRPATLDEVHAAVSALTRTPHVQVLAEIGTRDLLIRSARALTIASSAEIAEFAGVHATTVRRHGTLRDADVALVERVLGDPRFAPLEGRDLGDQWMRCRPRR